MKYTQPQEPRLKFWLLNASLRVLHAGQLNVIFDAETFVVVVRRVTRLCKWRAWISIITNAQDLERGRREVVRSIELFAVNCVKKRETRYIWKQVGKRWNSVPLNTSNNKLARTSRQIFPKFVMQFHPHPGKIALSDFRRVTLETRKNFKVILIQGHPGIFIRATYIVLPI